MPKKDLFEEKLALVYEYNRKSPLFVRAAGIEIEKNNLHKAVSILNGGLAEYPNYPTALILLGKAQMILGNFEEAEESFKKGAALVHSKETLNYYISELEKRRRKSSNLESRRVSFFDEDHSAELRDKTSDVPSEDEPRDQEDPSSFEERLDDLAKEISQAKISLNPEVPFSGMEDKSSDEEISQDKTSDDLAASAIASETLAKIYISQGKFIEALAIYKILLRKSPDRKEFYQSKIDEIEQQLGRSGR